MMHFFVLAVALLSAPPLLASGAGIPKPINTPEFKALALLDKSAVAYASLAGLSMQYRNFNDNGERTTFSEYTVAFDKSGLSRLTLGGSVNIILPRGEGMGRILPLLMQGKNPLRDMTLVDPQMRWKDVRLLPENAVTATASFPASAGRRGIRFTFYLDPLDNLLRRIDVQSQYKAQTYLDLTTLTDIHINPEFPANTFGPPLSAVPATTPVVPSPGRLRPDKTEVEAAPSRRLATPLNRKSLGLSGKIAFVSERDGNKEIYVMNANGTHQTRLTKNLATDEEPCLSPDGNKIAFTSSNGNSFEIYVMNADGSQRTRLVKGGASPRFSSNGKQIVFSGEDGLCLINVDGTHQTSLGRVGAFPCLSPDGKSVLLTHYDENFIVETELMNIDGTHARPLTAIDGRSDSNARFSPDGTQIAFISSHYREGAHIYLMKADGTYQTRLTTNNYDDWSSAGVLFNKIWSHAFNDYDDSTPDFSPDGTKLTFGATRKAATQIYAINIDGTHPIRLTQGANNSQPSWSLGSVPNLGLVRANPTAAK